MSILEGTNYGLCICLGDYQPELISRLLEGYEEDRAALAFGPITCFGIHLPKDRHREYLVRLVKKPKILKQVAMPIVKGHILAHGANKPVIVIGVDSEDNLRAFTSASEWLDLISQEFESMIKSDPILAAKFGVSEGGDSQTMLGHLGISVAIVLQAQSPLDRKFVLAMRRLAKNRKLDALLCYQIKDANSEISLNRLREIMTGGEVELSDNILTPTTQLFVVPARDESIDTELAPNLAPEVTLSVKPSSQIAETINLSIPIDVSDVKIGLDACLNQIWDQAKRNGNLAAVAGGGGLSIKPFQPH